MKFAHKICFINRRSSSIIIGIIIVFGLAPFPNNIKEYYYRFIAQKYENNIETLLILFIVLFLTSPFVPLTISIIVKTTNLIIAPVFVILLVVLSFLVGLFFTIIASAFGGVGQELAVVHGTVLTLAVISSIIFMTKEPFHHPGGVLVIGGLGIVTAAALWSLLCLALIVLQTNVIVQNHPFCLAYHGKDEPIKSLANLRGFWFYSMNSGYKMNSRWFFHGVLLVETSDGSEYFNWSPRRMRFDRIENEEKFIVPVRDACTPRVDFWESIVFQF